jgi:hypothetical protein
MWYNNNFYTDNEVFNYLTDFPSYGPKGRMLVIDANPEPYREPNMVAAGYNNEGGNVAHRSQMRDATFTLSDTVNFTMTSTYPKTTTVFTTQFPGKPAVSTFSGALGYYPGAENVPGGPVGQAAPRWMTKQWDASAVMPAKDFYSVKAPGYTDGNRFRFGCSLNAAGQVLCYSYATGLGYNGGTGNPGDHDIQYGWRVELIQEAADHTWAKVRVYNLVASYLSSAEPTVRQPITFTNLSTGLGPQSYLWDFGDGVTSTLTSPTHTFSTGGNHTVTLTVQTPNGSDQSVEVIAVLEYKLFLPTIRR